MKKSIFVTALVAMVVVMPSFTNPGDGNEENVIKITFVDHLTAGLIEQDVFVEKEKGSGEVYRVNPKEKDAYLDAPVYTTREVIHHDPFDQAKRGPYEIGKPLNMTLGQWLGGKGTATYVCEDGWGHLQAKFEHLVPNATYTLWHFFMAAPPTVPFNGTLDLPIGDRRGTQSVFTTDARGNASLDIRFEQCLQLTDEQLMAGLAIALHSDGKTYGPIPGGFGQVTHVHLFGMLPDTDDYK